jgi:hypothetical protein
LSESNSLKIGDYKTLTNIDELQGAKYSACKNHLKCLKESSISFYIMLVYSFIFKENKSRTNQVNSIANSLIDRSFLNGQYYFIFDSILNTLYFDYRFKILNVKNRIDPIVSKGISESEIFSLHKAFLFSHVIESIKTLPENTFDLLIKSFEFKFSKSIDLEISIFSNSDFTNTLNIIDATINELANNISRNDFFPQKQKDKIEQLRLIQNT